MYFSCAVDFEPFSNFELKTPNSPPTYDNFVFLPLVV